MNKAARGKSGRGRVQVLTTGLIWSALSILSFTYFHSAARAWSFAFLAFLFIASALFVPRLAHVFHTVLSALVLGLVTLVTFILLGACFYLIFAPLGWVLRLKGSLRTTRHPDPALATYWTDRSPEPVVQARYLRPF